MTVYTKTITVVPDEPTRVASRDPHPWRALEFDFGVGQVVWVVSHEDSIPLLPAGSSVLSSRMLDPFDYDRACGFLSGTATYSSPQYQIVDKDNSFSAFIADKTLNLVGSLNKVVREYEWDSDTPLPIYAGVNGHRILSKGTWLFKNHSSDSSATIVTVTCSDIYRSMDKKIFNPITWTVAEGFSSTATRIKTTVDADDFTANPDTYWVPFQHADHYRYQPSQLGTFVRLESTGSDTLDKEIVWCTGMTLDADGFVYLEIGERAQFLTTAQAVTIEANVEPENGPRVMEWIHFQETSTTLFEFLIDGTSGTRSFPAHWTAGYTGGANQYATGFHSSEFMLQFSNPGAQTVKKFLESEVLVPAVAVAPINGRGQMTFNPIVVPTDASAGEIVFDESNCVVDNRISLLHNKDDIYTEIEIKYDYDANDERSDDKFRSVVRYYSPESESFNSVSRTLTLELKGLHSGQHTGQQLLKLAGALGDKHYFERLEISIESFINDIPLGSLVSVQFTKKHVVDDSTGAVGPLNRTFTVIQAAENRSKRTTTYHLVGTLQLAQDFYAGQRTHNIEPAEYMRDGIDLAPMVAAGVINLEMGQKYYYYDPAGTGLTVPSTTTVNVTGFGTPPQIWCFGFLDWSPDIDLTGRSLNQGGAGQTTTTDATQGEYGFFGGQSSSVGMTVEKLYRSIPQGTTAAGNQELLYVANNKFNAINQAPTAQRVGNSVFPPVVIDVNNGVLGGIPADLSGAGGAGAPVVTLNDPQRSTTDVLNTATIEGSDGGIGGGGLVIVCQGMIMRGRVITNGGDAEIQNSLGFSGQPFNGSRGGGGDSGGLMVIIDGNHAYPLFDETNFHAFPGDNQAPGRNVIGRFDLDATDPVAPINPYTPTNLWESRLKVLYTPEAANVQAFVSGGIDEFFQAQRDGSVSIIVSDVDPSNANVGDMRITQAELDSNNAEPAFRVLYSNGWRDFDRTTDQYLWVYDALIAGKREFNSNEIISSPTRPTGEADGTIWHDSVNNLQWILFETSDDILISANQVPQGENLIEDPSFARTYAGDDLWRITRDDTLAPVYTGNPALPFVLPSQTGFTFARFLETGGEASTGAFQIDASGLALFNRLMFRDLIPNNGSPSLRVLLRLTSSLVIGDPATEGVAVRFRGFKLTGSAPSSTVTQVWDSGPSASGERAWYTENSGTFTDAVFIEPVPSNLGIDFFTFEVVVRAASGQINVSNIECRSHYAAPYNLNSTGFSLWTSGFSEETVATGISGDPDVIRHLRYIKTVAIEVRKGQLVQVMLTGSLTGRAFESQSGANAQRLAANVGLMIKLRRTGTTQYDYITVFSDPVSVDNKTVFANDSEQFRANYDYDQVEVLPFVEPGPLSSGYDTPGVDRLGKNNLELTLIASDFITASQGDIA